MKTGNLMNSLTLLISFFFLSCSSYNGSNGGQAASIQISTSHSVPLNRDLHTACTVDIFFGKKFQPRDILSDPYFSFLKDLNFTSLQYSGGSTSDYDHAIVGDTLVSGGSGNGYNIREEDCKARGTSIDAVLDGVGTMQFGNDFFNEYCALIDKLNIPGDIIANVQSGTIEELLWKIKRSHAKRVIFGMEQNLTDNAQDFPDGNAYREKITVWIKQVKEKYPDVKIALDAAPIFNDKPRFNDWNQQISDMPGDEVRLYLWDKDLAAWSDDEEKNLETMNAVFNKTIPGWFDMLKKRFPDKKVSVWQWGIKNKSAVANTMAACIYIGKFYEFMINYNKVNDDYISFASFMSLKSLNRGDGEILNHYDALKACGMLFAGNMNVDDLTITGMPGVSGVACEENGKYTVLLINESGVKYKNISAMIDQKQNPGGQYSVTSVSASSLKSASMSVDTNNSASLDLSPYSVNIVEF